jgi:hypothetical protein
MKTFVTDRRGRACAEKSFFARKTARGASSRNESDKSFGRHEHRTPTRTCQGFKANVRRHTLE